MRRIRSGCCARAASGQAMAAPPARVMNLRRRIRASLSPRIAPYHTAVGNTRFASQRKLADWLNMVEIEIGVLRGQCLDRRIDDAKRLVSEIAAWERQRNAAAARIKWMFTTAKARAKMRRAYPHTFKRVIITVQRY